MCGPDSAAGARTVNVNGAYARAGHYRTPPPQQVTYIDDTRHFMPAAPEAHEG